MGVGADAALAAEVSTAVVGGAGDEVGAVVWGSVGDGHGLAKRTSAAKAARWRGGVTARLKPCPLRFVLVERWAGAVALARDGPHLRGEIWGTRLAAGNSHIASNAPSYR